MLEQHRAIDRLLEELLDLLLSRFARAGSPPSLTADEDAPRRLLLRLRKTLAAHIELEDGILFREFEAQSGLLVDGPTATLRREHQVILARLDELGWLPSLQFEEGISKTIDWYLENKEWLEDVTSGNYQQYYEKMYGEGV